MVLRVCLRRTSVSAPEGDLRSHCRVPGRTAVCRASQGAADMMRDAPLNLILTTLNSATHAGQLDMPGMRFHPLRGGRFSVWVDENYRVTFSFENIESSGRMH